MPETPESADSPTTEPTPKPARSTAAEKRAAAIAAAQAAQAPAAQAPAAPAAQAPAAPTAAQQAGPAFAKRGVSIPVAAAIAVAALVGGVSGAGVSLWAVSLNDDEPSQSTSAPNTVTVNNPDDATTITAVAVKAADSVVTISVKSGKQGGTGSGVVLSKDGYVLTNTHVVTLDGATSSPTVQVQTSDGRLLDAEIVGTDPIADLAVIKVKDVDNLAPATFADSAKLNVGDRAIAIGAPLGLAGTVTDGIVSSLNRSIQIASSAAPDGSDGGDNNNPAPQEQSPFDFWQFNENGSDANASASKSTISLAVIQTDAAINPGNSGGALLDAEGNVIGINVAIASAGSNGGGQSGSIGVGFAIPSNLAQRVANEIIETGSATHGLLGASVLDVTEAEGSSDVVGASIQEVVAGGAADKAGLEVGDVITGVDGIHITGKTDLTAQVRALAAGSTATITYVRDGKSADVDVTLGTLKV